MLKAFNHHVRKLWANSLARNTGWMLVGQGLNLVLQTACFTILARLLGVKEYGIFAGAFAIVSIVTPYCSLGSGLLFMRYVSSDAKNFAVYWGNILISTIGLGSVAAFLLHLVAPHLVNRSSASLVLLLAVSECICRQLVSCVSQVFQAFEQLHLTSAIILLTNFLRFSAVLGLAAFFHHATALQWVLCSLVVSALAALAAGILVTARFGAPRADPRLLLSRFSEGFGFSLAGSSQSAYNDFDKAMMSHYGMNVADGIYTMAYRIVDLATIPINSLDAAALPRFFRQAKHQSAGVVSLSAKLATRSALLSIGLAAIMFLAAPAIPYIVGSGFKESIMALRWLCVLPVFRSIHQLAGSAITGLGYQRYRTTAQCCAALMNLGLNLWLIPQFGWVGAAWASIATDGALGITNWCLLQFLRKVMSTREKSERFVEAPSV